MSDKRSNSHPNAFSISTAPLLQHFRYHVSHHPPECYVLRASGFLFTYCLAGCPASTFLFTRRKSLSWFEAGSSVRIKRHPFPNFKISIGLCPGNSYATRMLDSIAFLHPFHMKSLKVLKTEKSETGDTKPLEVELGANREENMCTSTDSNRAPGSLVVGVLLKQTGGSMSYVTMKTANVCSVENPCNLSPVGISLGFRNGAPS